LRKYRSDVRKQAKQVAYSILQAEEYFTASRAVGIATKPLLLYYGAVSLSRALVLIELDGTYSYDALRDAQRHQHHGLDLGRSIFGNPTVVKDVEGFLEAVSCSLHRNADGDPWGHFAVFYRALDPTVFQFRKEIYVDSDETVNLWSLRPKVGVTKLDMSLLSGQRFTLLELMKTLPDLYAFLRTYDFVLDLARGSARLLEERMHTDRDGGDNAISMYKWTWDFSINDMLPETKEALLALYQERNPDIQVISEYGGNVRLQLQVERAGDETPSLCYLPDIVQDIGARHFYILKPDSYLLEPASHLAILYCFGMLCRYHPDIWIAAVHQNVRLAELIGTVLDIIDRKFPNLILDQMTGIKHYLHP
jgi:hypothetical protein